MDFNLSYSLDYKYVDPITKNTALILAAINCPSFIVYIIKYNYNCINAINIHQENALIIASKINRHDVVSLLLKTNININQQDDNGNTALHYAIQNKNIPMIYDLVNRGADTNIENNEGETALNMAKKLDDSNIWKIFNNDLSYSEVVKEIKDMKDIQTEIRYQHLEEYLYMRISTIYQKLTNEDLEELKTCYYLKISYINTRLKSNDNNSKNYLYAYRAELPLVNLFL